MKTRPRRRAARCAISLSILALALAAGPAFAECDTQPPALSLFDFNPKSVNVTSASQTVQCSMTFTDALAGVAQASCLFQSPTFMHSLSCTSTTPSSGDRHNGTFTCSVTVPRYAETGTWTVSSVTADDAVGNTVSVAMYELIMRGFPTQLQVTSTPDMTAPQLSSFTFTPSAVNVTSSAQTVTCSMGVTDSPAGVASAACYFQSPSLKQFQSCVATSPSSGTPQNGTFSCSVTIPQYAESGTWKVMQVYLHDAVQNAAYFDTATLQGRGFPVNLTVTSNPDVTPPNLVTFDFNPKSVDPQTGAKTVTCTAQMTDSPAGVQFFSCDFTSPSGLQDQSCGAMAPSSGTRTSGTWTCTVTLPQYSEGGTWLASVSSMDQVGNALSLDSTQLQGRGLPYQLSVACAGGSVEANLRFADHDTLVWDPVTGALSYNVYRGLCSDLVDSNADGLPDAGYGTCQNSRDPNTADTTFVDTQKPSTKAGFFYLVSLRTATGETGLGQTSDGLDRFVQVPCP